LVDCKKNNKLDGKTTACTAIQETVQLLRQFGELEVDEIAIGSLRPEA
jgi:hypothetical protein